MTLDRTLGIHVTAEDLASGKLARVKAEVTGIGAAGGTMGSKLGGAFKSVEAGAGRIGGALSHAKGALGGLVSGPLGILGLGASLFTVAGALETGIGKAQSWGLQIEKMQGITHNTAEELSGLLAVTEKFGLSNERLAQITGFSEKALGNLEKGLTDTGEALAGVKGPSDAVTAAQERLQVATLRLTELEANRKTKLSSLVAAQNGVADAQRALTKAQAEGSAAVGGADKFLKDYGFEIRDSSGKVKDFNTLLLTFSDYWNGNTAQGLKAAAAAKLFGRGYADLVPILNLGAAGIKDAEEEAAKLGLTLTQDNVEALRKAREATRQWDDALGGLELQVGLGLLPRLADLATWATSFVGSHRDQIVGFFKDAGTFAATAAGTIGNLVGVIAGFWNSIPEGLRTAILTGFIANKTIKFLFGIDPAKAVMNVVVSGIENALASGVGKGIVAAGLGKLFVQPVFVTNPGFGGPGGILPGLAGAGAGAAAGEGALAVGASAGLVGLTSLFAIAAPLALLAVAAAATPYKAGTTPGDHFLRDQTKGQASGYGIGAPGKKADDLAVTQMAIVAGQVAAAVASGKTPGGLADDSREGNRISRQASQLVRDPTLTSAVSKLATVASHWGYSPAEWQNIYARAMAAGGRSQINALARSHDKLNAIALADSETSKFMTGTAGPFFRDGKNQTRLLASLEKDQAYFNAHGDTATAAKLGADIALLRDKMHLPDVTVNVVANNYFSLRDQQMKVRSSVSTGRTIGVS